MKIVGIDGLSVEQVQLEVQHGAKFVFFQYCVSILVVTFKRASNIYFIRPDQSAIGKGMPFTLLSLVAGWWGIPWGPIYTIGAFVTNLGGGKDVTQEVMAAMGPQSRAPYTAQRAC